MLGHAKHLFGFSILFEYDSPTWRRGFSFPSAGTARTARARARRQSRASVPFAAAVMIPATGCWPGCSCCHVCGFSSRKRARSPCFPGIFLAWVPATTTESAHARFVSARHAAMRRTLGLFLVGAAAASAATLGAMPVRCLPDVTRPPVARQRATHSTHALGVLVPLETRMQKYSWRGTPARAPTAPHRTAPHRTACVSDPDHLLHTEGRAGPGTRDVGAQRRCPHYFCHGGPGQGGSPSPRWREQHPEHHRA